MRLFVAIDFPEDVREALWRAAAPLRAGTSGVRWVAADRLHLTLKFLGETDPALAPRLLEALREVAPRHGPFPVTFGGVGAFPNFRRPRVVWIGVAGAEPAAALAADIDRAFVALGIPREERPFTAHLTIGRVKGALRAEEAAALAREGEGVRGRIDAAVERVDLVRSVLSGAGPTYSVVGSATLGGG